MKYSAYIIFAFFGNVNRESEQKILYRRTLFVAVLNDLDYYYYSERGTGGAIGEIFGGGGEAEQKNGKKRAESAEYPF